MILKIHSRIENRVFNAVGIYVFSQRHKTLLKLTIANSFVRYSNYRNIIAEQFIKGNANARPYWGRVKKTIS